MLLPGVGITTQRNLTLHGNISRYFKFDGLDFVKTYTYPYFCAFSNIANTVALKCVPAPAYVHWWTVFTNAVHCPPPCRGSPAPSFFQTCLLAPFCCGSPSPPTLAPQPVWANTPGHIGATRALDSLTCLAAGLQRWPLCGAGPAARPEGERGGVRRPRPPRPEGVPTTVPGGPPAAAAGAAHGPVCDPTPVHGGEEDQTRPGACGRV